MLNCFKYFFFTLIYTPYPIMIKQKKKKKKKINYHIDMSFQILNSVFG